MTKYEEIEKVQELRRKGIITEEEFEVEKQKILTDKDKKKNSNNSKRKYAKIFFIIGVIALIITVIIAILYNNYRTKISYTSAYTEMLAEDGSFEDDKEVIKYRALISKRDSIQNCSPIFLIITDIMFLAGSVIQFISSKKNNKNIIILIVELVAIVGFSLGYLFLVHII